MEDPSEKNLFSVHLQELFLRTLTVGILTLMVIIITIVFYKWTILSFYSIFSTWVVSQPDLANHSCSAKMLWAGFIAFPMFHYLFLYEAVRYVVPGLFENERKMLRIPIIWTCFIPILSFFTVFVYLYIGSLLGWEKSFVLYDIRSLIIRFYLIYLPSTLLLSIPKLKYGLSFLFYSLWVFVGFYMPSHVSDAIIATSIEASIFLFILSIAALYFLKSKYPG